MRHFKQLAIVAAMICLPLAAEAADLRQLPPVYRGAPPPVVPLITWTGCYVGGNIGGAWSDKSFQDALNDYGGHTAGGFIGGGQVGCDFQVGNFVFGAQGMFDWTSANGSNAWLQGGNVNTTNIRWFSTLTGRLGFAQAGGLLFYGKAGGAWSSDDHTITNAAGNTLWTAGPTRTGWTAGLGMEWMFAAGWSAFAEYDYLTFGTHTIGFQPVAGGLIFPIDVKQNINMFLVGVNFRFGAPAAPVAARY